MTVTHLLESMSEDGPISERCDYPSLTPRYMCTLLQVACTVPVDATTIPEQRVAHGILGIRSFDERRKRVRLQESALTGVTWRVRCLEESKVTGQSDLRKGANERAWTLCHPVLHD